MECKKCSFYSEHIGFGLDENECNLTGCQNFYVINNCELVNDDNTVNYEKIKENNF